MHFVQRTDKNRSSNAITALYRNHVHMFLQLLSLVISNAVVAYPPPYRRLSHKLLMILYLCLWVLLLGHVGVYWFLRHYDYIFSVSRCDRKRKITLTVHNEELYNLYTSPCIISVMKSWRLRWKGRVVHMEEMRNAYKILVGIPEGKRPLRRFMPRW
jgi:hypothetical protein